MLYVGKTFLLIFKCIRQVADMTFWSEFLDMWDWKGWENFWNQIDSHLHCKNGDIPYPDTEICIVTLMCNQVSSCCRYWLQRAWAGVAGTAVRVWELAGWTGQLSWRFSVWQEGWIVRTPISTVSRSCPVSTFDIQVRDLGVQTHGFCSLNFVANMVFS